MRKIKWDFWKELELLGGFFEELDRLIAKEVQDKERQARLELKRERNRRKARRIYNRLKFVRDFDVWKEVSYMEKDHDPKNDFFDEIDRLVENETQERERVAQAKYLLNKKLRIEWVIYTMYHFWMFGEVREGAKINKRPKYSAIRKQFRAGVDDLEDKRKEEKWAKKREAVKARREHRKLNQKLTPREKALLTLDRLRKIKILEVPEIETVRIEDLHIKVDDYEW